jgi:hypothetical protein
MVKVRLTILASHRSHRGGRQVRFLSLTLGNMWASKMANPRRSPKRKAPASRVPPDARGAVRVNETRFPVQSLLCFPHRLARRGGPVDRAMAKRANGTTALAGNQGFSKL